MSKINFVCPTCEGETLEEVSFSVTQSATITAITDNGYLDYGEISYDGGELNHFECLNCGFIVTDEHRIPITDGKLLIKWLRENQEKPVDAIGEASEQGD
jgi:uncharacterized Zn finger protein